MIIDELNYSEEELTDKLDNQTLDINLLTKDFLGYLDLSEQDKKALEHLVVAARLLNDVTLEQDHPLNLSKKAELAKEAQSSSHAKKALVLFNSLNGVAGFNGLDKEPVRIFKDVYFLKGHNFYPDDLSVAEFHQILCSMIRNGEVAEVKKILSARTMVRRDGAKLVGVDYTKHFAKDFEMVANELEKAADFSSSDGFAKYLHLQAEALRKEDIELDMLADKAWAELQDTPLEFTLSRENYDDEITPSVFDNAELTRLLSENDIEAVAKDMLGVRVGIVNKQGTELILKFKQHLPKLAELMPYGQKYQQSIGQGEMLQTMVDVDIVDLQGDYAQCRGGITTAQNLPNNDKLSVKKGFGRRNVYHRQVRQSGDKKKQQELLDCLVDSSLHQFFDNEADHIFVIGHENGHSLGPDSSYQNSIGIYKHIIEENKADVISIAFMPEYVKIGVIDELSLKKVYASYIIARMLLNAEPVMQLPHRVAELIQFNFLLQKKAIAFNDEQKLEIYFDKLHDAFIELLQETVAVQLSKSAKVAEEFVKKYAVWTALSQKIAEIRQKMGIKPYKRIIRFFDK